MHLMVNQLGGGARRSFATSTIPKLKPTSQTIDSTHHAANSTHRERTLKVEYAPVFIVCGMVCVVVTIGSHTAYQQLACSPSVHVSKKRRELMPEVYDPHRTINAASKFINGSFLRKVSHIYHTYPNPFTRIDNKDVGNGETWVEVISWEPRAFLYHNFLTTEECEHLIDIAKPNMQRSVVVDNETGEPRYSSGCTSSTTFLHRGHDTIVSNIEKRVADFTLLPVDHGEGLNVIHYKVGQKHDLHYDFFSDKLHTQNGGQRIATVLMYLSDVEEGGETVFPDSKGGNITFVPCWNELSHCGKKGLSIKPKRGDALLFWNMKPDATLDPSSLHGSCPVIKGNKWACITCFRVNAYTPA